MMISIIFLSLGSCGSSSDTARPSSENGPFVDPPSPQSPSKPALLEEAERIERIMGKDENDDGVRDDIEAYIKNKFVESKDIQKLGRAYYMNISLLMLTPKDKESVLNSINSIVQIQNCLNYKLEDYQLDITNSYERTRHLLYEILDTDERIEAYIKANATLSGSFIHVGSNKDKPEDSCKKLQLLLYM